MEKVYFYNFDEEYEMELDENTTLRDLREILKYKMRDDKNVKIYAKSDIHDGEEICLSLDVPVDSKPETEIVSREDFMNMFNEVSNKFKKEFEKVNPEIFYETRVLGMRRSQFDKEKINRIEDFDYRLYEAVFEVFRKRNVDEISLMWNNMKEYISIDNCWEDGITPLMNESGNDDIEKIKFFLENGANPNSFCIYGGWTALDRAIIHGKLENVKILVKHGSLINDFAYGKTAIMMASERGHLEIVRKLLEAGACIKDKVKEDYEDAGLTARELAVKNGHNEVAGLIDSYKSVGKNNTEFHNIPAKRVPNN